MKLSKEQEEIIRSKGNIKINAVAGSGKTSTLIEYAAKRQSESKILYLAFNKVVKLEAQKKFSERNLSNVKVETAHSLAYRSIMFKYPYKIKIDDYKTHEIVQLLAIHNTGEKHTQHILARHILNFTAYFCNSVESKVQNLNYLDIIFEKQARLFVSKYYTFIESHVRQLLSRMDKGEIPITHDFYLKKFQLSNPKLHYDYILFDEGQDASAAMLDIFLKQSATKVIVGDTHQQIYGWRHAVNSLEKTDFKMYTLSNSYRFSPIIAKLALEILDWKKLIDKDILPKITGKGESIELKTKAIISRSNLGLLLKAIEYVTNESQQKRIYFEGNINSYTYADDGASLYDILNLFNGKSALIKDKLIKEMQDVMELEEYIQKTEDPQMGMMLEIVKEYGNDIPSLIQTIKARHCDNKENADIIFSTVHRCKGIEYDHVELVNDFITEEKIEKILSINKDHSINLDKINEEINLLYVAITRSKNLLSIPEELMPKNFPESKHIIIIPKPKEVVEEPLKVRQSSPIDYRKNTKKEKSNEKSNTIENIISKHKGAYQPWTNELDTTLTEMFCNGKSVAEMAQYFERTKGAIWSRIKKLELVELYG